MAKLEIEMRRINEDHVFMGSLQFPADVDLSDMVVFFRPDRKDPTRGYVAIEPRRDKATK